MTFTFGFVFGRKQNDTFGRSFIYGRKRVHWFRSILKVKQLCFFDHKQKASFVSGSRDLCKISSKSDKIVAMRMQTHTHMRYINPRFTYLFTYRQTRQIDR